MSKRFYKVNIEISNICNLQCTFCPEVIRPKNLMSTELFRKVLDQVSPFTKLVTFHLMGEPLVHPKLEELLDICTEKGISVFFVTNGVLLTERAQEWLLHPAIRQVNFSLHSFRDNFPEKDVAPYLEAIFRFTETAFENRPRLFINYRLWNLAHARSQQNEELLSKIEERFAVNVPRDIDTRIMKNFVVKKKLSLHYDVEFTWPALHLAELGDTGTCQGLTSHFGILVDGTVVPCCLDKEGGIALGNLRDTPLAEILRSDRARQLVNGFREGRLVEALCRRCQYIERFKEASLENARPMLTANQISFPQVSPSLESVGHLVGG